MTPPFDSQWTVPQPPPRPGDRPILGRRVAIGVGIAIGGHLLTIGITVLAAYVAAQSPEPSGAGWLVLGLISQLVLFVACLTIGIVWIVNRDRGIGLGLIIGWAVGVVVLPVIGFGACIVLINNSGSVR
jgi:hypothetical protein